MIARGRGGRGIVGGRGGRGGRRGRGGGRGGGKTSAGRGQKGETKGKAKTQKVKTEIPKVGELGREIMTRHRARDLANALGVDGRNVRNVLHTASLKMMLKQRISTAVSGPLHDQVFVTVVRTTVPSGVFVAPPAESNGLDGGAVEMVNTGAAFGKRESETLALIDLCEQLMKNGIRPQDPPDVRKMMAEREKETLKARKNRAQLVLEMVGATKPSLQTSQSGKFFVTDVSLLVDGGRSLLGAGRR